MSPKWQHQLDSTLFHMMRPERILTMLISAISTVVQQATAALHQDRHDTETVGTVLSATSQSLSVTPEAPIQRLDCVL